MAFFVQSDFSYTVILAAEGPTPILGKKHGLGRRLASLAWGTGIVGGGTASTVSPPGNFRILGARPTRTVLV